MTSSPHSARMARVKQEHTAPERLVRSILEPLGLDIEFHRDDLPGKPDIVLPSLKTHFP